MLGEKARGRDRATTTATRATRCASPRSSLSARAWRFLIGTFLSNIGLAVTDFAKQQKVLFIAAEPLTDKIVWENGNHYTFRLRPSTYMQMAMLVPEAVKLDKKRWAIVYPNYEYGQSATAAFKKLMAEKQPGVEFVTEQATPLGRIDAGAVMQALADAKPDAIFNVLFGADLVEVRARGQHARPVQGPRGRSTCWPASPSTSSR